MSSKRKVNRGSSSEEDESGRPNVLRKSARKRSPKIEQTFRIYYADLLTTANRGERKKTTETLELEEDTSEKEIREILISNLPQLRDKRFKFFTKDKDGNRYWCPCSLKCEAKDHFPFEWNGRNIRQSARSNRAVYILIDRENTTLEGTIQSSPHPVSGYIVHNGISNFSTNPMPSVHTFLKRHEFVPDLAKKSRQLNESAVDISSKIYQTRVNESTSASTSGYETILPENCLSPELYPSLTDEELQHYLDIDSPPNPSLFMDGLTSEVSTEPPRSPIVIEEIVPEEGNLEGGYTFYLGLEECCRVNSLQVQFDHSVPIYVEKMGEKACRGKVPPSSTPGVVQVKIVNISGDIISNRVPFTYTDENATKKHDVREEMKNMNEAELQELLIATAKRFGEMNLKSKEETRRYDNLGGGKTQALPLLRMIADTAARINAMDFFKILFSTHVGCTVFKSFKDEQPPLEEIARVNGHEELACLLEKKHLMYRDDENESDDEVDWKAITKAVEEYQAINDESVEKWSIQSTDSSERLHGYLGDGENSTSLTSLHVSVSDSCHEDKFEEQQVATELQGREESYICHAKDEMSDGKKEDRENYTPYSSLHVSVGEGCYEDTFKEQQAATESRYPEKSDNCHEKIPSSFTAVSSSAKIEMNEVHKLYGTNSSKEEMKLVVRSYPDPFYFPSDDVFGRNYPKFASREVESLRKKLNSFDDGSSTQFYSARDQIVGNPVEGKYTYRELDSLSSRLNVKEGYLNTKKPTENPDEAERKLNSKMSEGKNAVKFPDVPSFHSLQPHLEEVCCLRNVTSVRHLPLEPVIKYEDSKRVLRKEHASVMKKSEENEACVCVNEPSNEPDPVDHSNPLTVCRPPFVNQNKCTRSCTWRCAWRTRGICLRLSLPVMVCFIVLTYVLTKELGTGDKTTSAPIAKPAIPCNKTQHWIKYENGSASCIDCLLCPPGQGLSTECGSSKPISPNTLITCVPCPLGVSFSSKNDTSVCTSCSSCAEGQVVQQHCSAEWDTKCAKQCSGDDSYYDDSKGVCFRCSKCCDDDQDVFEDECKGKLGAGSSMICSFHSSVNRCENTTPSDSLVIISVIAALTLLALIVVTCWYSGSMKSCPWCSCCDVDIPLVSINTKSQLPVARCYKPTEGNLDGAQVNLERTHALYKPGEASIGLCKPLLKEDEKNVVTVTVHAPAKMHMQNRPSQLLKSLLDSNDLDEICDCLDMPIGGNYSYETIARHYGAKHTKIKVGFKNSEAVIEWLVTVKPDLTVREFATVVWNVAKRRDVAQLLEAYDLK